MKTTLDFILFVPWLLVTIYFTCILNESEEHHWLKLPEDSPFLATVIDIMNGVFNLLSACFLAFIVTLPIQFLIIISSIVKFFA